MNCQISGLAGEDEEYKQEIQKAVMSKCERLGDMTDVIELKVYFKKYKKEGTKAKHSVKLHLFSRIGDFVADASEWEIMNAVHEALRKIEVEFKRKRDKLAN